jgi:ribonuclease HI
MTKKKFYAVAAGRSCGIFTDWPTAEAQVKGHPGAKYKSFASEGEARAWLDDPVYRSRPPERPDAHEKQPQPQRAAGEMVVYTDGGCIDNPGPGGYGVVIDDGCERREMSGGFRLTTNNRMEMTAAIVALEELRTCRQPLHLYSDSSYLVNGIEKGWAGKWRRNGWRKADGQAVMNIDLWQRLLQLLDDRQVVFHWVKGHAGNEWNERCDRLAVAAARQSDLPADEQYEKQAGSGGNH